jgi:hypothetical protein
MADLNRYKRRLRLLKKQEGRPGNSGSPTTIPDIQTRPPGDYGVKTRPAEDYGVKKRPDRNYGVRTRPPEDYGVHERPEDEYGVNPNDESDVDPANIQNQIKNQALLNEEIGGMKQQVARRELNRRRLEDQRQGTTVPERPSGQAAPEQSPGEGAEESGVRADQERNIKDQLEQTKRQAVQDQAKKIASEAIKRVTKAAVKKVTRRLTWVALRALIVPIISFFVATWWIWLIIGLAIIFIVYLAWCKDNPTNSACLQLWLNVPLEWVQNLFS